MNSRESKQIINVEKIIIGLKNEKREREKKKGNSTELQKLYLETEVYNSNKNVTEEKKKAQKLHYIS